MLLGRPIGEEEIEPRNAAYRRAGTELSRPVGGAVGLDKGHSKPPERYPVITSFPGLPGSIIARYRYGDGWRSFYTGEMSGR